ncbi:MAG: hypothetical protein H0U57_07565 [Tatlockia sp.]|nr:hypothetical protein [Tatlockia sp.]
MANFYYDEFCKYLNLPYRNLTSSNFNLSLYALNAKMEKIRSKKNSGNQLSWVEANELMEFCLFKNKYSEIAIRANFLNSWSNHENKTAIVNHFNYSSYKVAKFFLEVLRGHSSNEHTELVTLIERKLKDSLHYVGASLSLASSRWHKYSLGEVNGYEGLQGDELKTAILMNFRHKLEEIAVKKEEVGVHQVSQEMSNYINEFKQSAEYVTLKKCQGMYYSYFKRETDSQIAVETIIDSYAAFKPRQPFVKETSEIQTLLNGDAPMDSRITF